MGRSQVAYNRSHGKGRGGKAGGRGGGKSGTKSRSSSVSGDNSWRYQNDTYSNDDYDNTYEGSVAGGEKGDFDLLSILNQHDRVLYNSSYGSSYEQRQLDYRRQDEEELGELSLLDSNDDIFLHPIEKQQDFITTLKSEDFSNVLMNALPTHTRLRLSDEDKDIGNRWDEYLSGNAKKITISDLLFKEEKLRRQKEKKQNNEIESDIIKNINTQSNDDNNNDSQKDDDEDFHDDILDDLIGDIDTMDLLNSNNIDNSVRENLISKKQQSEQDNTSGDNLQKEIDQQSNQDRDMKEEEEEEGSGESDEDGEDLDAWLDSVIS